MFEITQLQYDYNAFEPFIKSETVHIHYDKHHKTYCDNLNNLIKNNSDYQNLLLEKVIEIAHNKKNENGDHLAIFNNAAQVWNHDFYWNCMKNMPNGKPKNELLKQFEKDFESFESFKEQFIKIATSQFGSGWCWCVFDIKLNKLLIIKTSNADNPLIINSNYKPLFVIDVWEHAYYLDYQNKRIEYVKTWISNLVNWDLIETRFNAF